MRNTLQVTQPGDTVLSPTAYQSVPSYTCDPSGGHSPSYDDAILWGHGQRHVEPGSAGVPPPGGLGRAQVVPHSTAIPVALG